MQIGRNIKSKYREGRLEAKEDLKRQRWRPLTWSNISTPVIGPTHTRVVP